MSLFFDTVRYLVFMFGLTLHGLGIGVLSSNFKPTTEFEKYIEDFSFWMILVGAGVRMVMQLVVEIIKNLKDR